jgi:choline-glycine betaine transporter
MPLDAVSGLAGPDIDPLNLIVSITLEKQTTRGLEEEVEAVVVDSVPFDPLILLILLSCLKDTDEDAKHIADMEKVRELEERPEQEQL